MAVLRRYNPDTQQWDILQGGVQGLQGPPVSLAKGTVATGAPGSSANFSVTGTPPALTLNLTIPRGDVGPVGPTFGSDGSIIAAGRPDLPATMDSATQAAVSSASPGTLFRSTDGASVGAWAWMKRPTGWTVIDGDTGWRILYSNGLRTGYNPVGAQYLTAGRLRIRRTLSELWVSFDDLQWSGGEVVLLSSLGSSWNVWGDTSTYPGTVYDIASGITRMDGSQLTAKAASGRLRDLRAYPSIVAWPTTLPGTPG